ncbi:uncharacterized protein F4822DRAFT_193327 [Hypoxylon trugodes]|uniref:uncharacterized protein n=1 Tax=Hypoxylon trugodes TaxID=326681 RepID=UPI0021957E0A|nr:uncharacterized protein F4822DRAFT_193327 [Hypoxylon trugodes]KAI1391709.1 hypothetical protein F4822DRAFT_193327 [Hypoxylon trugodes]
MADTPNIVSATSNLHDAPSASVNTTSSTQVKPKSRPSTPKGPPLHQLYALPVPIRTFPLPSFYPNNPISLFHVIYAWVGQLISPPPAEPAIIYQGIWSPETRSVHIKDPKSIRALWEQGFFGKGNYSRSEPNWLKREQARKGNNGNHIAEDVTAQRREERKMMKWDRARKEQEAIQRTRLQEAWVAPVGPMELLALPNSEHDLKPGYPNDSLNGTPTQSIITNSTEGLGLSSGYATPNGDATLANATAVDATDAIADGKDAVPALPDMNGYASPPHTPTSPIKRRKSVRFSPKVDSTTFQLSDPPNPNHGTQSNGGVVNGNLTNGSSPSSQSAKSGPFESISESSTTSTSGPTSSELNSEIVDKEHLQLCLEEVFYLVFALGALTVLNPVTGKPFTTSDLFTLCRQTSYIPPRMKNLQPDDPFLIHYAAYHHFRSLGWVTRPGIKFGVDWMLYNRGPVFSHAEFAVIVLPAYTGPWWKTEGRQPPRKSWHWLHTINRVQATALKTLVLAYVDIPPPFDDELGATEIFKRYRVREFIVRRWLSNRNRD